MTVILEPSWPPGTFWDPQGPLQGLPRDPQGAPRDLSGTPSWTKTVPKLNPKTDRELSVGQSTSSLQSARPFSLNPDLGADGLRAANYIRRPLGDSIK